VRRVAVLALALASVGLVGVLVARSGGHGAAGGSASVETGAHETDAQPALDGLPTRPEVEAARAAAVRAVGLTDEVVRAGLISRRELIESFATPDYAPALAGVTSEAVTAMLLELGERDADTSSLAVVEQPVTAGVDAQPDRVRVRVWSVLVIAVPGAGPGRQVWRTVTLDMVQSGGRWLVDGWSSSPGPTPASPAEGTFDDAAALLEPIGWPAALDVAVAGGAG
jgi:hypothetical protein